MVSAAHLPLTLPLRHEQPASRVGAILLLGLLILIAATVAVPFGMLAATGPDLVGVAVGSPYAMAQIGFGALLWIALFAVPVAILARRKGTNSSVHVTASQVTVTETTAFGTRTRTLPLRDFDGLVHVVRTSVSGIRHELLLVAFASRTRIVVRVADRIDKETVEGASRLLGLPVIAARDAIDMSLARPTPRGPQAAVKPALAA